MVSESLTEFFCTAPFQCKKVLQPAQPMSAISRRRPASLSFCERRLPGRLLKRSSFFSGFSSAINRQQCETDGKYLCGSLCDLSRWSVPRPNRSDCSCGQDRIRASVRARIHYASKHEDPKVNCRSSEDHCARSLSARQFVGKRQHVDELIMSFLPPCA